MIPIRLFGMVVPAALFVVALSVFVPTASAATTTPVLAATVNVYNATTTAQSGNTLTIAFDITNGAGVQPGVKYGLILTEGSLTNQKIVDQHVYNDVLNLGENSTMHKVITYTAPVGLSGTYDLSLSAKSSSGFPYATVDLGKVSFKGSTTGTLLIDEETCSLSMGTSTKEYSLNAGIGVAEKNGALSIHCSVQNDTPSAVTLVPAFVTHKYGVYGDIVSSADATNTPVTLAPKEAKEVAFHVSLASAPQSYAATFSLQNTSGTVVSNGVPFTYTIAGGGQASILSATLDKDAYRSGDAATISVFWNSSQGIASSTLAINMVSKSGTACISPISYPIVSSDNPYAIIPATVVSDCVDPKLSVSIKNPTLGTLDAREFNITSSSSTPVQGTSNIWYLWLVGAALFIIVGISVYFRKAKARPISL